MPKKAPVVTEPEDEEIEEHEPSEDGTSADPDEGDGDEIEAGAGEDAEHEGDEDVAGEDEGQAGRSDQVRQPTRGENRFQSLSRSNRELKDRLEDVTRQLGELRQPRADNGAEKARAREAELERARLDGPSSEIALRDKWSREDNDAKFGQLANFVADTSDRNAFEALCARTPAIDAIRDEVERERAAIMRQGFPPMPRESIAAYLIGKKALARAPRAHAVQQKRASARIENERGKPVKAGSDTRGGDGRGSDAQKRAKRLENVSI